MNVSIVIATCGSSEWSDLAWSRAFPSASDQQPKVEYDELRGGNEYVVATVPRLVPYAVEIVIQHHPELSVAEARNAAAAAACGDWLCFLDADDELCPGYLAKMIEACPWTFPTLEAGWTSSWPPLLVPSVCRIQPDGRQEPPAIPSRGRWPGLNECVVGTLIWRAVFARLGGFRTDLASLEDYDLFLRAYDAGSRLFYVEDAVYCQHVSEGSRNADQSPYARIWADHLARAAG